MSSDSELGPSPLPSPIFARCSPARGTVARKCREFYLRRLERTAIMQKRWSICDLPQANELSAEQTEHAGNTMEKISQKDDAVRDSAFNINNNSDGYPLRKCRSSLDLAMDSLRKEISSLIAQDNDLFRQLLSLHDSIAELRERQRHSLLYQDDDDDDDIEQENGDRSRDSNSPSLESLSDPGELPETSPESTLSSRSSLSANSSDYKPHKHHHHHNRHISHRNRYRKDDKQRHRAATVGNDEPRPIIFIDKSEICFRCRKMAPPYRRSSSITSLYYLHEDMESYDSGIHLQGSHSDSDHEIFV